MMNTPSPTPVPIPWNQPCPACGVLFLSENVRLQGTQVGHLTHAPHVIDLSALVGGAPAAPIVQPMVVTAPASPSMSERAMAMFGGGAPAAHVPPAPVTPVPQVRALRPLRHLAVFKNRERGVRVLLVQQANGAWSCCGVRLDDSLEPWVDTHPTLWYADVWDDIGTAPPNVLQPAPTPAAPTPPANPVAPPDAPPSVSPGYAAAVPPGTALSPAVAARAGEHTLAVAQKAETDAALAAAGGSALVGGTPSGATPPSGDVGESASDGWRTAIELWAASQRPNVPDVTLLWLAEHVLNVAPGAVTTTVAQQVGRVLAKLGWTKGKATEGGGKLYSPPATLRQAEMFAGAPAVAPVQTPSVSTPSADTVNPGTTATGPHVLFVDCVVPGTIGAHDLEQYVARCAADLARAGGVADIRCTEEQHVFNFGGWKGALAAYIRQNPPVAWPCSIRIDDGDDLKKAALAALRPLATGGVVEPYRCG